MSRKGIPEQQQGIWFWRLLAKLPYECSADNDLVTRVGHCSVAPPTRLRLAWVSVTKLNLAMKTHRWERPFRIVPSSLWAASCSLLGFWVWAQWSSSLRSTESCGRQRAQSGEARRLLSLSIWRAKAWTSLALSSSTTGKDLRENNENSGRCLLLKSPWRPQKSVAVKRSLKKVEEPVAPKRLLLAGPGCWKSSKA